MPRFHLNLFNGIGRAADEEGQDWDDLAGARAEAIRGIRSLLAAEMDEGTVDLRGRIEITDPDGRLLQTIAFNEAVTISN